MSQKITVYSNPWFRVVKEGRFHYVEESAQHNSSVILPRHGDRFLLAEVCRPANGGIFLEAPRGSGEDGETPSQCAQRELHEETGIQADEKHLVKLGRIHPNSAILASSVFIFLAEIPDNVPISHDSEIEGLVMIDSAQLKKYLSEGRIMDSFTLSAFALLSATRNNL